LALRLAGNVKSALYPPQENADVYIGIGTLIVIIVLLIIFF
jgi:hypothetical protein